MMMSNKKIRLLKRASSNTNYGSSYASLIDTKHCQIEIPGIGRLQTGEQHDNFHRVAFQPKREEEMPVNKNMNTEKHKVIYG
jgi:hypothetical protein